MLNKREMALRRSRIQQPQKALDGEYFNDRTEVNHVPLAAVMRHATPRSINSGIIKERSTGQVDCSLRAHV